MSKSNDKLKQASVGASVPGQGNPSHNALSQAELNLARMAAAARDTTANTGVTYSPWNVRKAPEGQLSDQRVH